MRRSERQGDLMMSIAMAMGLGVGLVAGFVLAEAVGAVDRERVSRAVARLGTDPAPAPLPPARAARAAAIALAEELGLADVRIESRALAPGRVELLGWVPDRRRRALAERTVAALAGITGVVNRLLVEQEDSDSPVSPAEDGRGSGGRGSGGRGYITLADQSA